MNYFSTVGKFQKLHLIVVQTIFCVLITVVFMIGISGAVLAQEKRVPASRSEVLQSFAPLVKRVAPAVVNIFSKRVVRERVASPLFNDPFFKRFFGDDFGLFGVPRDRIQNSLGSGVIVSADGMIVTNHHVISAATEITVVLADRREFPAELVLDDERTDLAILRIDPKGESLPTIPFKDTDEVEVGDLVLAIGNPFGVGQTVTSGIVSALARTKIGISDFSFFIQTDAAINPGNSGGALVTLDGKLLGINTAIFSQSGGSIGIGFAIPSDMVRTVVASAAKGGDILRAWTGLTGQTLTQDLAEGFGLDRPGGVIVSDIYRGGPADQAGLRSGDIVLSVDNRRIEDFESLRYRLATSKLGDKVRLDVWRDRRKISLDMPLIAAPETPARNETTLRGPHPLSGAVVANLSPAMAEELELPGVWEGVIITKIIRGTTVQRAGFRPGDIIVSVNGQRVERVAKLVDVTENRPQSWLITYSRQGRVFKVQFGA